MLTLCMSTARWGGDDAADAGAIDGDAAAADDGAIDAADVDADRTRIVDL